MKYFLLLILLLPTFGHASVFDAAILYNQKSYDDALLALQGEDSAYSFYWGGKIRMKMGDNKKAIEDFNQVQVLFAMDNLDALDIRFKASPLYGDLFYQMALIYKSRGDVDKMETQRDTLVKLGFKDLAAKIPNKDDAILTAKMNKRLAPDMEIDSITYAADWAKVRAFEKYDTDRLAGDNFHINYFYRKVNGVWASVNDPERDPKSGADYGDTRQEPSGLPQELSEAGDK